MISSQIKILDWRLRKLFRGRSRRILFSSGNAAHLDAFLPLYERLASDRRLSMFVVPNRPEHTFDLVRDCALRGIPSKRVLSIKEAQYRPWDLFIASDFREAYVSRRCERVHLFHGHSDKRLGNGSRYSFHPRLGSYQRVLFVNAAHARACIERGLVSQEAAVVVGMPKLDWLVGGPRPEDSRLRVNQHMPLVCFLPSWNLAGCLESIGEPLIRRLAAFPCNLIVKLHPRSFLPSRFPGVISAINWLDTLERLEGQGLLRHAWETPTHKLLRAADVVVTDYGSLAFESLLSNCEVLFYDTERQESEVAADPAKLQALRRCVWTFSRADEAPNRLQQALEGAGSKESSRARLTKDLFFEPGRSIDHAIRVIYDLLELDRHA